MPRPCSWSRAFYERLPEGQESLKQTFSKENLLNASKLYSGMRDHLARAAVG